MEGLRGDIRLRMAAANEKEQQTCQSSLYGLDGLSSLAENAARAADTAMENAPGWRRAELAEMAESCRRIARQRQPAGRS